MHNLADFIIDKKCFHFITFTNYIQYQIQVYQ